MKKISILLTKYSDAISEAVYLCCGRRGYTHASLALEGEAGVFYSFNFRGFCVETVEKHRRRGVSKSLCYELYVTDEAYSVLRERIGHFRAHAGEYRYTRLGVFLALLGIPFSLPRRYICSQFVAELLQQARVLPRERASSLFLPCHFPAELDRCCCVCRRILNPV